MTDETPAKFPAEDVPEDGPKFELLVDKGKANVVILVTVPVADQPEPARVKFDLEPIGAARLAQELVAMAGMLQQQRNGSGLAVPSGKLVLPSQP